ncbi:SAV_6107 family HEPN domain-containing protein [Lentzea sp.]|uniref:SAV_6107 family HEPN domain-containing protein n=1 Tax=Lentzea sp. TaxID=56099 RepID=UPI002ED4FD91
MTAIDFPIPLPPASALALLQQARDSLAESGRTPEPPERFATAYLAALRAAAAVLALRGRPHRGRSRPTSAWVLLTSMAPELSEWAAFFTSWSSTRAAVLAGITRHVNARTADDMVRQAGLFVTLVDGMVNEARR